MAVAEAVPLENLQIPVIFVIGGPGSGKGTQCAKIVEKYNYTHLSTGDLLRDEVNSGSERGKRLEETMQRGELVSLDEVLQLLKEAIQRHLKTSKGFLVDGYPREVEQAIRFEKEVCKCSFLLYFDVSDGTMTKRLLQRGISSGRVDDNETTIKSRLQTFHSHSQPILDYFGDKVKKIPAEREPEEIFLEVCNYLSAHQSC
ncbi:adenylate kinase isoenzyme 1-like [Tachypleus tridentatus]|uniref:adenylate kinase isoenzyme 1-like n=1 Tax=Tachypleus tridentatus TaxID=6853 RepID=UPI003FD19A7C